MPTRLALRLCQGLVLGLEQSPSMQLLLAQGQLLLSSSQVPARHPGAVMGPENGCRCCGLLVNWSSPSPSP